MQARAHVLREEHVARDDRLLGDRGPARQAELRRHDALVHLGALGEARLLRVLGDDAVERLDVLEGAAHEDRVVDALPVVREHPHAGRGVGHRAELGELLAREPDGDGAHGVHVDPARVAPETPHLLDDARGVRDRGRVRHRVHGREAARRRGAGAGRDRLGVLAPRLAQVGVQVDQPGQGDEARRVDDDGAVVVRGARGADRGELGDHAVREDEVDGVAAQRARAAQDVRGGCGAAHEAETLSTAGTGWAEGRAAADAAASASSLPARRR